jgi:hypothetical protein
MASLKTGFITLAVLGLAGPLHAAGGAASRVGELRTAQERVARAASSTKGGPQHLLLQEQRKLSDLIDDLEHGRQVDPAEIDRAIQHAENPGL